MHGTCGPMPTGCHDVRFLIGNHPTKGDTGNPVSKFQLFLANSGLSQSITTSKGGFWAVFGYSLAQSRTSQSIDVFSGNTGRIGPISIYA